MIASTLLNPLNTIQCLIAIDGTSADNYRFLTGIERGKPPGYRLTDTTDCIGLITEWYSYDYVSLLNPLGYSSGFRKRPIVGFFCFSAVVVHPLSNFPFFNQTQCIISK